MNIRLCEMTKELAREYYRGFEMDPELFADMSKFRPYAYSAEKCVEIVERHHQMGRVFLAVMLDNRPVGEVVLKNIDRVRQCCTLGIHMQNDNVKNKGYGTQAEKQAIEYAFQELGLHTVYADAIHKNKRSQHVLTKVGFRETHRDDAFIYYRCDRCDWVAAGQISNETL